TGLRARLGELTLPTLLIWGESDQVFPIEACGYVARNEIPEARLVVLPHCGHFPQIESPRLFQGVLAGFLAGLG
ncbi:MAG: alpha/beta hydrolase, partial [Chloroflexia bacterium]|nr:alpha/beta hydrolase [Chloroflexia bacterium]